jgi:hypothetical protein
MAHDTKPRPAAGSNPIPAELVGQARTLHGRIKTDFLTALDRRDRAADRVLRELGRRVSRPLVHRLSEVWRDATADADRLAFHPAEEVKPGLHMIAEDRAAASESRMTEWATGDAEIDALPWAETFDLVRVSLMVGHRLVGRKNIAETRESRAIFTVHALARHAQRTRGGTVEWALADTVEASAWAAASLGFDAETRRRYGHLASLATDALPPVNMPPVIVPTAAGFWIGNLARMQQWEGDKPMGYQATTVLRTFYADDMLPEGSPILGDVRALRGMGADAATGSAELARALAWIDRSRREARH